MSGAGRVALVPGDWVVRNDGWRLEVVRLTKVTDAQVRWQEGNHERRGSIASIVAVSTDETAMRKVAAQLTSAKAECRRREQAARVWLTNETARICKESQGTPS